MRIHALEVSTSAQPRVAATNAETPSRVFIQYGGRQFSCSVEMAQIFLKHARDVIESGDQQLVPLLHVGGVELLLVSRVTPYSLIPNEEK